MGFSPQVISGLGPAHVRRGALISTNVMLVLFFLQLWKMKGEEYRIHGLWGWQWTSSSRKVQHVSMNSVGLRAGPEKITIPIKSNGGMVRGLPINPASFYQLAEKNPSLQFSLLSPKQKQELWGPNSQPEKEKEVTLAAAGRIRFHFERFGFDPSFPSRARNLASNTSSDDTREPCDRTKMV